MKKTTINNVEVIEGSGNVYADLGMRDADKMKIKAGLVATIQAAIKDLEYTQEEAAKRMGIPQPRVSIILNGNFRDISERKLLECLTRLGYDVQITVRRAPRGRGRIVVGEEKGTDHA